MKLLRTERAFEPCAENGYYGYFFYFDNVIDADCIEKLGELGVSTYIKNMKRPFFLLRGSRFNIRGQMGDDFCKVGIEKNDAELLARVRAAIEAALTTA